MTQQEIEVFLAVVKMGNVSGAAQALYITQPAVSRHIRTLERELGCPLFERGRGRKQVELTDQGRDFVEVAKKWSLLWQEAREVTRKDRAHILNIASVGSVSSYLLPEVLRRFLSQSPNRAVTFHNYHSQEAYNYVGDGLADLAIISDDMYHPQVETIPSFREPMVLLTTRGSGLPQQVHPSQLDPARELRCPWNPEFDLWHSFWFSTAVPPQAELDQMSLLENFFSWSDSWSATPLSVARAIQQRCDVELHQFQEGPPDRIIYYLLGRRRKPELTAAFLQCMDQELQSYPEIESFL